MPQQRATVVSSGTRAEGRPALVFVHGAGGDASLWEAQAQAFQEGAFVCRVVLPGHGGQPGDGASDIRTYARCAGEAIREALGQKPFVLAGHSMGGAIALDMALEWTEGLSGLVLLATGARLEVAPLVLRLIREDFEGFLQTIDRAALGPGASQSVSDTVVRSLRRCTPEVIHGDFLACDRFDVRDRLHDIRVPTIVVCGQEDRLTPMRLSSELEQGIEGARLVAVPEAGHMVMLERPDAVNKALEAFLR